MEYFKQYFSEVTNWDAEEVKVLCPFHNDTVPSAGVNTTKEVFHCFTCSKGYDEAQFYAEVNGVDINVARGLLTNIETKSKETYESDYKAPLWADSKFRTDVRDLGLTLETIEELDLGRSIVNGHKFLTIPVLYNNAILDVRKYNLYKDNDYPKVLSDDGAEVGYVIPYDLWAKTDKKTYIFEGEKDMLLARSLGINGVSITGGCKAKVNDLMLDSFKGKDVVICYDNDKPGRDGANKLGYQLLKVAKTVSILDIGDVVNNDKEDFYDYITSYGGTVEDFYSIVVKGVDTKDIVKYTTISKALSGNIINKRVTSKVTVVSEYSDTYGIPTYLEGTKGEETGQRSEKMLQGEQRVWTLTKSNAHNLLELIEADAKNANLHPKFLKLLEIPTKEPNVFIKKKDYRTVYKVAITDEVMDGSTVSLDIYTFTKLDVGKQYEISYKILNHPTKNQKLVALADEVIATNGIEGQPINKSYLQQLQTDGSVDDKVQYLYNSAKHHVAKHLNFDTWLTVDLVFNSILDFDYGGLIRGALDVFILGDTQVGKSETTSKLTALYDFGKFLSLKTSTTIGLIGGSNKVEGSWCNTIGAIPRQHKKLVVLEEFSGAKPEFIKTMTDIRSSNELRIARASGELRVPCKLRMITISNPINDINGNPRFLASFPNGVSPLTELIKSAEDVARYDGFILIPKVEKRINPFQNSLKGARISESAYKYKAKWVASRKAEDVVFEEDVQSYIWEQADYLNSLFECNFPMFGTTTDKKLARFCVAMASLIVNTDETYEQVIVTKDIVDYVVKFLIKSYTSPQFRLDKYKQEYDSYNISTADDVRILSKLYANNAVVVDTLSKTSRISRNSLKMASGLDGDRFNPMFNLLIRQKLIKMDRDYLIPTNKFRVSYGKIIKENATIDVNNNDKEIKL